MACMEQHTSGLNAHLPGALAHLCKQRVKGVLGIDQRHGAALLLHFCHGVQGQGRLAAALCRQAGERNTNGIL